MSYRPFWGILERIFVMIKLGIYVNPDKDKDFSITNDIIATASSFYVQCEIASKEEEYDYIISLGGDGTFLSATKEFLGTPILGVNLGRLGFLTEIDKGEIQKVVFNLVNEKFQIEERFLLETEINGNKLYALNDIVINRAYEKARLFDLTVSFNGKYADEYMADGVIVSTPTGSTAYCLSAGGPIVEPKLDVLIVTPVCAHSLHHRPIIVGADTLIGISSKENTFMLTSDGQIPLKCEGIHEVRIKKSDKKAKIVKFEDRFFFDILREKFHLS